MVGGNSLRGHSAAPTTQPAPQTPRAPELPRQSLARSRLRIRGVLCRTPQETKLEYARQGGHIRGRSRHLGE